MSAEKLISRYTLDNGLTLEFWDQSRLMAGDRWLVVLEARMVIPIGAATLPSELLAQEAEVVSALGPEIVFSQQQERIFIDIGELPDTLKEIEARILALAPSYLGHPEFAGRFIRKRYAESREKQRWVAIRDQDSA